jgi:predicted ATPase
LRYLLTGRYLPGWANQLSWRSVSSHAPASSATLSKPGSSVRDAIALAEVSGERYYTAELHRLHGELLVRPPHAQKRRAEASFRTAIRVAKEQGAAALQRRANESLHRWFG